MTNVNELGLNGFGFVEFTGPDTQSMEKTFNALGFVATHKHPHKDVKLLRQGKAAFLLSGANEGQAKAFAAAHGASANGLSFRFKDPKLAFETALARGARAIDPQLGALGADSYVIEGIGGALLYLMPDQEAVDYLSDWIAIDGAEALMQANETGLYFIDHLTHNVRRGQMRVWSDYYARLFGFEEQKYFDIKGKATGLFSQAMIAPDKAIRIPLNESQDDQSQIEEFIRQYNGEGIQHIALATDDIYQTVEALRKRGVALQDTIETYYELVDARVPNHGEDLERLKKNRILIDGNIGEEGLLLQIFTENQFGPIFFEIIQRKGNEGFGNGNFQALFESIELDQIRRGVVSLAT